MKGTRRLKREKKRVRRAIILKCIKTRVRRKVLLLERVLRTSINPRSLRTEKVYDGFKRNKTVQWTLLIISEVKLYYIFEI